MKAMLFRQHGGVEVMHLEEVAEPEPGPDEVLVRVRSCSVNRGLDLNVKQDGMGFRGFTLPHVSGADAAGDIVKLGSAVTSLHVGQRVAVYPILSCGRCDFCLRGLGENYCYEWRVVGVHIWGGYAEYMKVPARNIVPLPDSVSYDDGSAAALVYTTAWHGLVSKAHTGSTDTVLVLAAASGVGTAGIQIAKHYGARVIAAASSPWKLERACAAGADAGVDYSKPGWSQEVLRHTDGRGADVIFDSVGRTVWEESMRCLNRAGRVVCCGATAGTGVTLELRSWYRNNISLFAYMVGTYSELREIVGLIGARQLAPIIDRRFPLEQSREAQQYVIDRHNFGKVMINP